MYLLGEEKMSNLYVFMRSRAPRDSLHVHTSVRISLYVIVRVYIPGAYLSDFRARSEIL